MEFGLIGEKLGQSCSPRLHQLLAGYDYQLRELADENAAKEFLLSGKYRGVNVTIPYKKLAYSLCDELDDAAKAAGAVNTVVNQNGRLLGYNTDLAGFERLAASAEISFAGRVVLVLGTGGTSGTARAAITAQGPKELLVASRTPGPGQISYEEAKKRTDVQVLVNTTPVGMFPHEEEMPIDPGLFPNLEGVLDVVYNPLSTALVTKGRSLGVKSRGGLEMLVWQAALACEKFTGIPADPRRTRQVLGRLAFEQSNIVLIGMPSCGKSTIGRKLSRWMGRPFVDLDRMLEEGEGCTIPEYFAAWGEEAYRKREAVYAARAARGSGQVIACGGGVVEGRENLPALRRNGLVIFIDRPVEGLRVGGHRPLSTSPEALRRMEQRRRPLYESHADLRVENPGGNFDRAARAVLEAVYAYFDLERAKPQSAGHPSAQSVRKRRVSPARGNARRRGRRPRR